MSAHTTTPAAPGLDSETLDARLAAGANPIPVLRDALRAGDRRLDEAFAAGAPVDTLVTGRAALVDSLIRRAWSLHLASAGEDLALVAVGGYGRGELHPCSDIDLTILAEQGMGERHRAALEAFLTLLWDIGLEVGHSVRTLADCVEQAGHDITVATNLMEARLLAGSQDLYAAMQAAVGPDRVWPSREFFAAKWAEQQARHAKFHNTAYKLEPNVKESPGGLRDIQMIGWVAKRHFGARTLHDLVAHDFLTEDEFAALKRGQDFLWRVRFALHVLAGRREDRLLFDSQLKLARQFGYEDTPEALGVEQFMQQYYREIMELSRLNEMLLQLFQEALLLDPGAPPSPLTARFQARQGFLEAAHPRVFAEHPPALLELFHVLQQNPELKGVSAHTIRLLRGALHLIDDAFRAEARNRSLFMDILGEPRGVTHELRRMNRYGVLGRYIPAFGRIVGRMQYDLFHIYTVDEHILFVVSNLRRFALPRFDHEFPLCSSIMQSLERPQLVYLAGLFHDIAKGRGGDHSELGAVDAETFCLEHGLSRYEARVVAWLVQHHLLLSVTAQKKDINDPRVLHEFATTVGDQFHLNCLYLLTVADVRATNPDLWNSWKASLFSDLFTNTQRALRRGLENPIDKDELVRETQEIARRMLHDAGLVDTTIDRIWLALSENYFLQHTADEIAWHTEALARHGDDDSALVIVRQQTRRGGTAISIYSRHDQFAFGRATAVLDQLGLTVVDARIVPVGNRASLDTYVVLEDTGEPIEDPHRVSEIRNVLQREVERGGASPIPVTRRAPRQVRMFTTPTQINFSTDARNNRTVMEISTGDRPGLLSEIGRALADCGVSLQYAKITTIGERAEDVFFISDALNQPLGDSDQQQHLHEALLARIGNET